MCGKVKVNWEVIGGHQKLLVLKFNITIIHNIIIRTYYYCACVCGGEKYKGSLMVLRVSLTVWSPNWYIQYVYSSSYYNMYTMLKPL